MARIDEFICGPFGSETRSAPRNSCDTLHQEGKRWRLKHLGEAISKYVEITLK